MNNALKRPLDVADRTQFYVTNYNISTFLAQQGELRHYVQIFIDSWLLLLSIPMRRLTRSQNERMVVSTVCLVSIIFMSIYQSGLATVYVKPLFFKDIDTLDELDASDQKIFIKYAGYLTDVFPNDSSSTIVSLHNKMVLDETDVPSLQIVKTKQKVASITRKSTITLDNSIYFMKQELHLVEECPKNYFLAYMVPANSVFLERINEILYDIQRFGFIQKWIDEINYEQILINMRAMRDVPEESKTLTLDDLKFAWLVLIVGNCCGSALIAIEIVANFRLPGGRYRRRAASFPNLNLFNTKIS